MTLTRKAAGAAVLCALVVLSGFVLAEDQDADPWSPARLRARFPDPDAGAQQDDYVGVVECKECHEDRWKSLGVSFHAALRSEKESGTRGCETCHGPGRAHYDDGGDGPIRHPLAAPARESVGVCLACHVDVLARPIGGHRAWLGADDAPRACVECHEIHVDKDAPAHAATAGFPDIAALEKVAEYIPAERCIACHPGFHPEMRRSGHRSLLTEGRTCGTCHGPGSLHEESGGRRDKIVHPLRQKPKAIDATCNACHRKGEAVQRWTCAEHAREGVSCVVCHDPNAREGRTLRKPEIDLCGGCHLDVKAKFRLPNRHRVVEGRMSCSDCHDPHGNRGRVRDSDVRRRVCADCHAEKTGPFFFDHGIKRSDGCIACHDPHGSVNRRMLTHKRTKPLCLQCHPETPHNLRDRKYDNCIACHIEIHGSDLDRLYRR